MLCGRISAIQRRRFLTDQTCEGAMASGEWYYAKNNQQQGPVTLQAIQEMVRGGQIQPGDLIWRQGMANWLAASQVPEVYAARADAAAPAPAYAPPGYAPPTAAPSPYSQQPYGQQPYGQPAYGQPVGYFPQQQQQYPPGSVPNYLVPAILATLFCCLPFGIVSIVYAAQVNSKLAAGDYAGAMEASQKAKTWAWWSFGIGLIGSLAYMGLIITGAAFDQH
jgi:interferon-induced transmembrane protein/uncharacterized protein DUF4339